MNITIFSFSNYSYNSLYNENNNDANVNIKDSVNNQMQIYPSPKKLAKYIKLLMLNFPEKKYNFDFFIFYTIANIKYSNFSQKYLEINQIFNSYNISKDINYENKENKHKEIYKNDNNNNISENNIIQQLKDKILALDNDEEYNGENSEFNSQISKMINSNLKSNTIASDSSFIMNDLISSYCDTNSHTKNKTIEHNNNKNGKMNKSSFKIEKINKDKKYFLNQIINLNKSYNSRLKSKNKSSSKQIKVKNIKDKFAGKLVKLNKIYTKDFKNFGNFYLESKSFSKKNNI
jgi:hypothetical protein